VRGAAVSAAPRVSVVLPAYRSEATVAGCLAALRRQTFADFDVVLVDSGPGGGTAAIVARDFPEVRCHVSPARLLPHAARNLGISLSSGELLLLSDPDTYARPDWIQLHGSESPGKTAQARQYAGRGLIKALGIARSADLAQAAAYEPVADMLLFDAKPPPGGLPGGNALAFDWAILSGQRFSRPWFLSGGLTPENVAEAITASGAALVDVSSGVEAAPGLKDPSRIAQFLAATRV